MWKTVAVITICSLFAALAAAGLYTLLGSGPGGSGAPVCFLVVLLLCESVLLVAVLERRAPIFGKIFHRGPAGSGMVALTFDDGPNEPYTSQLLGILERSGIKATFFVIGMNCERFPDALKKIAAAGHEIGNHTFDHEVLPLKRSPEIEMQIRNTSAVIEKITGEWPALFRAPHGWRNPWTNGAVRRAGCKPVAWTLGVWDTDRPGAQVIIARTLKGVRDGCILLLHDGRGIETQADSSQVVQALPAIIEDLKHRGFRFVTVSEMMEHSAG
ncbi:MAG: polysaccharide deacetylase family protein [Desulfobacteraceae bacterium]|nr:polysaccharide deacetylase family protein [Desulfobacteraceae bacterium]